MIRLSSRSKVFARTTCSVSSNACEGARLEEALTQRALLELTQHRHPGQAVVLVCQF
jgi:hypothetical protein